MRAIAIVIMLFVAQTGLYGQDKPGGSPVRWMRMEEALAAREQANRPLFIDLYTDWCGWCKKMDQAAFSDPTIANYLNQYFYPVKFNAETKDSIEYNGTTYYNKAEGRRPTHELAIKLANGRMSYPTIVYIPEDLEKPQPVPGYRDSKQLMPMLVYFAEKVYKFNINYQDYEEAFNESFLAEEVGEKRKNYVGWVTFEEAMEKSQAEPRKTIVAMYSTWNMTSQMHVYNTLNTPEIAMYVNDNYYAVAMNVNMMDTISFQGKEFTNYNDQYKLHQLPVALTNNKLQLPSFVILDEKGGIISVIPGYFTPETVEPMLHFFSEEAYKEESYPDYVKDFKGLIFNAEEPEQEQPATPPTGP